jgi:hypothetical protein
MDSAFLLSGKAAFSAAAFLDQPFLSPRIGDFTEPIRHSRLAKRRL